MLPKRLSICCLRFRSQLSLSSLLILLDAPVRANIVGNDSQNFNPVPGKNAFVTVNSTSTLEAGRFNLGLFANSAANSLPYEKPEQQKKGKVNDMVTGLDLLAAVGVHDRFEMGVAVPFIVHQTVREDSRRGEFEKRGNTEVRPVVKWAFYRGDLAGAALMSSVNINRLIDDPYTGGSRGLTLNVELGYDIRLGSTLLGANIGYRRRSPGEKIENSLVDPLKSRYLASLAARLEATERLALIGEVYGSAPAGSFESQTNRENSSSEALAGLRYTATPDFHIDGGLGTELGNGLSTPDLRIYTGIVAEFGPQKKEPQKPEEPKEAKQTEGPGPDQIPEGPPDEVFVFNNINFEFDSDFRVLPGAITELKRLTNFLTNRAYKAIVVEGHTDFKGTVEYNDDLSLRRARTVRRHLIKHYTLDQGKVIAVGYGERRPATSDTSDQGRQVNRRVEIKIYYP